MSKFIRLQMFIEQRKKGYSSSAPLPPPTPAARPFPEWKVGYFVKSAVSSNTEEWKITNIESSDGLMHNEDCTVTLQNAAEETRTLKGRSLRASYQFVSTGDVVEPTPEAPPAPVEVPAREDVQFLTVNIDGIREFYARKYNAEGSRVLMLDKTAYIVVETPTMIHAMIEKTGGKVVTTPQPE